MIDNVNDFQINKTTDVEINFGGNIPSDRKDSYSNSSPLRFGDQMISSERGVQQGPFGPALF